MFCAYCAWLSRDEIMLSNWLLLKTTPGASAKIEHVLSLKASKRARSDVISIPTAIQTESRAPSLKQVEEKASCAADFSRVGLLNRGQFTKPAGRKNERKTYVGSDGLESGDMNKSV